jgi:hypothetical protein
VISWSILFLADSKSLNAQYRPVTTVIVGVIRIFHRRHQKLK